MLGTLWRGLVLTDSLPLRFETGMGNASEVTTRNTSIDSEHGTHGGTRAGEESASPPPSPPGQGGLISTLKSIPTPNLHQRAGYLILPLVLHHAYVHRILPYKSSLTAFFSYSFVSHSLSPRSYPSSVSHSSTRVSGLSKLAHGLSYGLLTVGVTWHALVGLRIISFPTSPRSLRKSSNNKTKQMNKVVDTIDNDSSAGQVTQVGVSEWRVAYSAVVASVGLGIVRMVTSGHQVPDWLGVKYDEILRRGWKVIA